MNKLIQYTCQKYHLLIAYNLLLSCTKVNTVPEQNEQNIASANSKEYTSTLPNPGGYALKTSVFLSVGALLLAVSPLLTKLSFLVLSCTGLDHQGELSVTCSPYLCTAELDPQGGWDIMCGPLELDPQVRLPSYP